MRFSTMWLSTMRSYSPLLTRTALLLWAMLLIAPLTACAQSSSTAPQLGVDYEVLEPGQRWQSEKGKHEIVEVFAYWCHHCADFQPMVDAWKTRMPKNATFRYVPAAFDPNDNYARAFFAAEMAGVQSKIHQPLFDAIHKRGTLPKNGGTIDEIGTWFATQGLNRAKMIKLMQSKEVAAKMERARAYAVASRVQGTPTLILNGKYVIRGRSLDSKLRILDALLAREARPATQTKP